VRPISAVYLILISEIAKLSCYNGDSFWNNVTNLLSINVFALLL